MADVLRCKDYWGRPVVLTSEVWYEHILMDHAEMSELQHMITKCLEEPDLVNHDSDFRDREAFYLLEAAGSNRNRHIKVCVEYRRRGVFRRPVGDIRTAFVANKVKVGEELKWRRSD